MPAAVNTYIQTIGLDQSYDSAYMFIIIIQFAIVSSAIFNTAFIISGIAESKLKDNKMVIFDIMLICVFYILTFSLELFIYYGLALFTGPIFFTVTVSLFNVVRLVVAFFKASEEKTLFSNFFHSIGFNVGNLLYKFINSNLDVKNFNKNYKRKLKLKYLN